MNKGLDCKIGGFIINIWGSTYGIRAWNSKDDPIGSRNLVFSLVLRNHGEIYSRSSAIHMDRVFDDRVEKCWRYLKIYTTNLNSSEKWSTPVLHYIDRIDWKPSLIIRNHLILFHNTHYYLKYYLIVHCVPGYKQRACLSCSLNASAQHSVSLGSKVESTLLVRGGDEIGTEVLFTLTT